MHNNQLVTSRVISLDNCQLAAYLDKLYHISETQNSKNEQCIQHIGEMDQNNDTKNLIVMVKNKYSCSTFMRESIKVTKIKGQRIRTYVQQLTYDDDDDYDDDY